MAQKNKQRGARLSFLLLHCLEIPVRLGGVRAYCTGIVFLDDLPRCFQRYFLNVTSEMGRRSARIFVGCYCNVWSCEASRQGDHVSIDLLPGIFSKKKQYFLVFMKNFCTQFSIVLGISATEG